MLTLIKYYGLELKNSFIYLFRIIAAFLLILVISAGMICITSKKASDSSEDNRVIIAVVSDENDELFIQLLDFANDISSIKGFCKLQMYEYNQAMQLLKDGKVAMVMHVPEGFMDKASHMEEAEFTVYLPQNAGSFKGANNIIIAMMHSVEQIMMNMEGAILTMYEGMSRYDFSMSVKDMENDMMQLYMMNFLGRDSYFDTIYLSEYGNYSVIEYYLSTVVLILAGILAPVFFGLYNKNTMRIEIVLSKGSVLKYLSALVKILCITLPVFVMLSIEILIFKLLGSITALYQISVNISLWMGLLFIAFSIGILIHLCASVFSNSAERFSIYILILIIMALLSGSAGSAYYLPHMLKEISDKWPLSNWRSILLGYGFGNGNSGVIYKVMLTDLAALIIGCVIYAHRLNHHET